MAKTKTFNLTTSRKALLHALYNESISTNGFRAQMGYSVRLAFIEHGFVTKHSDNTMTLTEKGFNALETGFTDYAAYMRRIAALRDDYWLTKRDSLQERADYYGKDAIEQCEKNADYWNGVLEQYTPETVETPAAAPEQAPEAQPEWTPKEGQMVQVKETGERGKAFANFKTPQGMVWRVEFTNGELNDYEANELESAQPTQPTESEVETLRAALRTIKALALKTNHPTNDETALQLALFDIEKLANQALSTTN